MEKNAFISRGLFIAWAMFILLLLFFIAPIVNNITSFSAMTASFFSLNTIFLSILIEALPFVLIGVLIAGFIQIFLTEEHLRKWIPKNKFLSVIMGCFVGALFPACECGIVPIVRRLITKGVPLPAAIGFMLTGPLINPIVIISTYMAFGNNWEIAGYRMVLGFIIAIVIALLVSLFFKGNQFKKGIVQAQDVVKTNKEPLLRKMHNMLKHAVDEFFDMGKYLIIGAFLAAFVQTYMSTKALVSIGDDLSSSLLVMMGLAFILSLCSEADAFIGASFSSIFPTPAILSFLIFGPMIDLKNTIMLLSIFKVKFVVWLFIFISAIVYFSLFLLADMI
ncbi:permease [Metasolibacillus meyeri]|uniref:Permease n=1 Tax=Metasolibacillus meyeri TaxID=1071052 RepID=A0AAW9NWZ6_9BACL|nr:permease [Metasolibacillus meyeri]MEC1180114.1 permease [Metasolibacillus meyeri]